MKKKNQEIVNDYLIDYDLFNVEEIVKIINFMHLIEDTRKKKIKKELLIEKYNEYRKILNNKSLEKQYDQMLFKKSGVSIYEVMKNILKWEIIRVLVFFNISIIRRIFNS